MEQSCSFHSLGEGIAFLKKHFTGMIEIPVTEVQHDGSELQRTRKVPRYVFRGEERDRSVYSQTVSAWWRLEENHNLEAEDRSEIGKVTRQVVKWLCSPKSNFDLQEHDAFGLVQHLGLPTEYIDFSADPEVAGAFAVGESDVPDRRAAICVLDVQKAISDSCGRLADFRDHVWCERARRQQAYGYAPLAFHDLKSQEGIEQAGLWWFEFPVRGHRIEEFLDMYLKLLDIKSDPVSGLLRHHVNGYVADTGKLRSRVAKRLSETLPMAPLFARKLNPAVVEFLPPGQLQRWDEETERKHSLHYWSPECKGKLERDYLDAVLRNAEGMFHFPGTYHPSRREEASYSLENSKS
jgi:hypothetical protein